MVCEKNKGNRARLQQDPIELVRKGNFLMANARDSDRCGQWIAVATNLAIMEDKSLQHGPLNLFTVDEETGLTGATNVSPDFLSSKTLMNLGFEEEGAFSRLLRRQGYHRNMEGGVRTAPAGTVAGHLKVLGLRGGTPGWRSRKTGGMQSRS